MKTTVEIPDSLYRRIKARAALRGQTIKAFLLDAVRDKLVRESVVADGSGGWRAVFGKANKKVVAELQEVLDEEYSRIDPEDWQYG